MIINNVSTMIGKRRLNISETAKIAGVDYNTVEGLYHDKTSGIKFETLNKLCYALECSVSDLFTYIPD